MKNVEYVDTLGAVQMNNGVVRLYFVSQDPSLLSQGIEPSKVQPELANCVAMPLPGFLYAMSVINNFIGDERMQKMLQSAQDSGSLPPGVDISGFLSTDPQSNEDGEDGKEKSKAKPVAAE
ncbi:MAG: hypothetical protein AAF724_03270 [Pseudomonadota bacterium]